MNEIIRIIIEFLESPETVLFYTWLKNRLRVDFVSLIRVNLFKKIRNNSLILSNNFYKFVN